MAAVDATLNTPYGLALNPYSIYIADNENNKIRIIDRSTGIITTFAGSPSGVCGFSGDGGPALDALLCQPRGLALDGLGNLYIVDNNHRIRRVNPSNIINTVVGGGATNTNDPIQATSVYLNDPEGIAIDNNNNLYISDTYHNCVRLLTISTNIVTTFAGDCLQDGSSTSLLYNPQGLLYSSRFQAVFIVDYARSCVKYALTTGASAGQLVTVAGQCNYYSAGFSGQECL